MTVALCLLILLAGVAGCLWYFGDLSRALAAVQDDQDTERARLVAERSDLAAERIRLTHWAARLVLRDLRAVVEARNASRPVWVDEHAKTEPRDQVTVYPWKVAGQQDVTREFAVEHGISIDSVVEIARSQGKKAAHAALANPASWDVT